MKKPGILNGALIGALLTAPMMAVFYLGWKAVTLSFVPFNLFDWLSRVLPGAVVIFGIENMVKVIRALHLGSTAVVAKAAEQSMALIIFFLAGVVGGVILDFLIRLPKKSTFVTGTIMGVVFAVPMIIISIMVDQTTSVSPVINVFWISLCFAVWGFSFGRIYQFLGFNREADQAVQLDRRRFLIRLGGVTAVITVAGASVGMLFGRRKSLGKEPWSATHALPNADAKVAPAPGNRPEFTPVKDHYRIDINTTPPRIDGNNWRLKFSGMMEKQMEFTLDELRSYQPMNQFITLECISNPVDGDLISTQRWTGVSLQRILPDLRLKPEATHLKIASADGFFEIVSLDAIKNDERIMFAYAWDGLPLTVSHGFPLRIYIPDRFGMKQPKWIESVEAIDQWEAGYWVVRGWDRKAQVKSTSVIDTVAVDSIITTADGRKLIPMGGIAYAGARGISRVQLQLDDGDWLDAELRTPLSPTTWVIWRYNLPFREGEHTLTVRCFQGDGTEQITVSNGAYPSGATGLNSKSARF
jgi:DMSO/TMAO reductase YedYZ molybdopterin-dependent catalytic subunit